MLWSSAAAALPLTIVLEGAPARRPRSYPRGSELLASCAGVPTRTLRCIHSIAAQERLTLSRIRTPTSTVLCTRGQKGMRNSEQRMGRVGGNQILVLDRNHGVRGEFWSRTKRNERADVSSHPLSVKSMFRSFERQHPFHRMESLLAVYTRTIPENLPGRWLRGPCAATRPLQPSPGSGCRHESHPSASCRSPGAQSC